jgi:hypothetical protein
MKEIMPSPITMSEKAIFLKEIFLKSITIKR